MAKRRKRQRRIGDLADQARSTTSHKKKKRKKYKRGTLIKQIYAYFDKVGVDDAKYDVCEKLAKKIKPDTKFNKYHFSWYKNDYKNKRDIP